MNIPRLHGWRVVLACRPHGKPLTSDFRLESFAVPALEDGEVLLRVRYLSLDPYMRGTMDDRKSYRPPTPVGGVMVGEAVAEVLESRHSGFRPGELVLARTGWVTHSVLAGQQLARLDERFQPVTTALGILGMPGFTAYTGVENIGRPQQGETVVVAAASGPVGSLVGQLAKIKGARAVGIAGGPEKCTFVREKLGFDAAIDHRAPDFPALLADACPDGIDIYFENVGGAVWQAVLPLLNMHARVPLCGLIAQYSAGSTPAHDFLPATMNELLSRRITVTGFINSDFAAQRPKFLDDVSRWIAEGRIHYRENVISGLENAPGAFIGMLEGSNFGKLLVEI
ncbi:NADP-dependent oxidoreductase [Rhizobium sp. BK251]|uniref:NADP-dependent oxidoreductase n=1 Tax=Rhizobium sp. BK251 TaxID=2512125 RepID=UPI00104CD8D1|nr:NADP-dependent oxidoreductase [Rhizobium sp. BK251]TCL64695.1 hypothetical protein EV286_114116 [Rhizobium sp. BK251]